MNMRIMIGVVMSVAVMGAVLIVVNFLVWMESQSPLPDLTPDPSTYDTRTTNEVIATRQAVNARNDSGYATATIQEMQALVVAGKTEATARAEARWSTVVTNRYAGADEIRAIYNDLRSDAPAVNQLAEDLNRLDNTHFDKPATTLILAESEDDFKWKAEHVTSMQTAEERKVEAWIYSVVAACDKARAMRESNDAIGAKLVDTSYVPPSHHDLRENTSKLWLEIDRVLRQANFLCDHEGYGFRARFEDVAEDFGIVQMPAGW